MVDNKNVTLLETIALVVEVYRALESKVEEIETGGEHIVEAEITTESQAGDESDYYTLEELEIIEDKFMSYLVGKFKHIRCRRNYKYKIKSHNSIIHRSGLFTASSSRGGYKIKGVDRSKFWCYNNNELRHFATE